MHLLLSKAFLFSSCVAFPGRELSSVATLYMPLYRDSDGIDTWLDSSSNYLRFCSTELQFCNSPSLREICAENELLRIKQSLRCQLKCRFGKLQTGVARAGV